MNHTEIFNQIMERNKPIKKEKIKVQVCQVEPRDNMSELQTDLSKCTYSGCVVQLPFERLENYDQLRKALLQAGAVYKKSTFVFPNDAKMYIDKLMGGEVVNLKKEFQFFPTPAKIAEEMAAFLNIKDGESILEPSAGQGALIEAIYDQDLNFNVVVDYYELMDVNKSVLNSKVFTGLQHIFKGNDFLNAGSKKYDKIIANPPFNKNQDIDHILKMWECLNDGGRIVTLSSTHWQHSCNKKETNFKKWLDDIGATWENLEQGSFKDSGTNIAVCFIIIDK